MEPKKNVPLHTRNLVCSGTKEVKFFNSIFEIAWEIAWEIAREIVREIAREIAWEIARC